LLACLAFWGLAWARGSNSDTDVWLALSAIVSLLGAALAGAFGGLGGRDLEAKAWPNQGTWLALRNAGIAALAAGLAASLALGLTLTALNVAGGVVWGIVPFTLRTGLVLAVWAGLAYGGLDFVQHFSLRLVLWLAKRVPGRLVGLLDHAVERGLLQRPGGSYKFFHPLLLEHFARSYETPVTAGRNGIVSAVTSGDGEAPWRRVP